ncbi:Uncharacterized protein SCF082_LOCUS31931 [Durusdinium trenchii]|uniref:Uncharacterized protein n=1 Tax=Durusdinium trenchii TaxID=1381693 RepID=A0ABP0NAI4_9DINO
MSVETKVSQNGNGGAQSMATKGEEPDAGLVDRQTAVKEELGRRASIKLATKEVENEAQRLEIERQAEVVRSELQRRWSIKEADKLADEELERIKLMETASEVMTDLVRRANQHFADSVAEEERARRIAIDQEMDEEENQERRANQKQADEMEDAEKKRREVLGLPTGEAAFEKLSWIANEVVRAINKRDVLKGEDEERERRILEEVKHNVILDLQSAVHLKQVKADEEDERARRVAIDRQLEVNADVESHANRLASRELEFAEQQRRVMAAEDHPFGVESESRTRINEGIRSAVSKRESFRAMDEEQAQQVWKKRFDLVIERAASELSRMQSRKAFDDEKAEQEARDMFSDRVLAELGEHAHLVQILKEVKATQEELSASMKDTLERRQASPALGDLLTDIERRGNQLMADRLMELERERRGIEDRKFDVNRMLERKVSQKGIAKAVQEEQAFETHRLRFGDSILRQMQENARLKSSLDQVEQTRSEHVADMPATLKRRQSDPSLDDLLVEIQRLGQKQEAVTAMESERERRGIVERNWDVLSQLQRKVSQQNISKAVLEEYARTNHGLNLNRTLEQLQFEDRRKIVDRLTAEEQERRSALFREMDPLKAVDIPHSLLVEDIERQGNRRLAELSMELERERRNLIATGGVVRDQLVRKVSQRNVKREVDSEKFQRVVQRRAARVFEELERRANQSKAAEQSKAEQNARVANMANELTRRDNDKALQALLEDLERHANRNDVLRDMELEREERVFRERLSWVIQDLQRHLNRLKAVNEAEEERIERVSMEKSRAVLEELERFHNALEVDRAASAEQEQRVRDSDIERNRRADFLEFYDVLEDVERRSNQVWADRAADFERDARLTQRTFMDVLGEMRTKESPRAASDAMDAERVMRTAKNAFLAVNTEFERRVNCMVNDKAANQERLRRVAEIGNIKESLLVHDLSAVHEEMLRRSSWRVSKGSFKAERSREHTIDLATAVHEELLRKASLKQVDEAIALERCRIADVELKQALHLEMFRTMNKKKIDEDVEIERADRVANAATTAIKFASVARTFQGEIPAAADNVQSRIVERLAKGRRREAARKDEHLSKLGKKTSSSFLEDQHRRVVGSLELDRDELFNRLSNQHLVEMLSDQEKARRIAQAVQEDLTCEIERRVGQMQAAHAVDVERFAQLSALEEDKEQEEEERRFRREWASFLMEEERKRRAFEEKIGIANALPRPDHLVAILKSDAKKYGFDIVESQGDQESEWSQLSANLCVSPRMVSIDKSEHKDKMSQVQFFLEQQRKRMESKEHDLREQMVRFQNRRKATRAAELERFERVQKSKLGECLDQLNRAASTKQAKLMADLEQDRRLLEDAYKKRLLTADSSN